jgi:hypothetical protein
MYVKDQGEWEKEDEKKSKLTKAVKNVADKNIKLLPLFREKFPEYKNYSSLILQQQYCIDSIKKIEEYNPSIKFLIISDDVNYVKSILPEYRCEHFSIGIDYYIINKAKWLIISNSSFAYFPAYLNNDVNLVIAPKYWSRYNVSDGYWGNSLIFNDRWYYLNRSGYLETYEQVYNELEKSKYFPLYVGV